MRLQKYKMEMVRNGVTMLIDYALIQRQISQGNATDGSVWSAVNEAARRGGKEAQFTLGYRWYIRYGASYRKARNWISEAAKAGHTEASKLLAEIDEELIKHRQSLQSRAEAGEIDAQQDLAALLATDSDGFGMDLQQSRKWYQRAAEQNIQNAQYNLGLMMLEGEGGPVDTVEGLSWLERAAQGPDAQSSAEAAGVLAHSYEVGALGLPCDNERASYWRSRCNSEPPSL